MLWLDFDFLSVIMFLLRRIDVSTCSGEDTSPGSFLISFSLWRISPIRRVFDGVVLGWSHLNLNSHVIFQRAFLFLNVSVQKCVYSMFIGSIQAKQAGLFASNISVTPIISEHDSRHIVLFLVIISCNWSEEWVTPIITHLLLVCASEVLLQKQTGRILNLVWLKWLIVWRCKSLNYIVSFFVFCFSFQFVLSVLKFTYPTLFQGWVAEDKMSLFIVYLFIYYFLMDQLLMCVFADGRHLSVLFYFSSLESWDGWKWATLPGMLLFTWLRMGLCEASKTGQSVMICPVPLKY